MREIRTSGSVRGEEGNLLTYSTWTRERPAIGDSEGPRCRTPGRETSNEAKCRRFGLTNAGEGEELGTYEETVKGHAFSFVRQRYVLSDGTEVIWSVGNPTQD